MHNFFRYHLIVFAVLMLGISLKATAIELKFGPEFTVSNQKMMVAQPKAPLEIVAIARNRDYNNPEITRQKLELLKLYVDETNFYRSEVTILGERRLVFESPEGWSFNMGVDPAVLEFTTTPMTLAEFEQQAPELQRALFDIPKKLNLEPQLFAGGGHINIGVWEFKDNPLLFYNFLVDYFNHNELHMGIFGYDTNNSISPWLLPHIVLKGYERALQMILEPQREFSPQLIREIESYFTARQTDNYFTHWRQQPLTRRTATSLGVRYENGVVPRMRIEIRTFRPQKSMDMFIRQIRLLQKRVNYLKKLNRPLQLKPQVAINPRALTAPGFEDFVFNPPVNPQAALKNFYQYVTESGESWQDHQDYIWPWWIQSGELDKFNQSLHRNCSELISQP